jgi:hypothetical protein
LPRVRSAGSGASGEILRGVHGAQGVSTKAPRSVMSCRQPWRSLPSVHARVLTSSFQPWGGMSIHRSRRGALDLIAKNGRCRVTSTQIKPGRTRCTGGPGSGARCAQVLAHQRTGRSGLRRPGCGPTAADSGFHEYPWALPTGKCAVPLGKALFVTRRPDSWVNAHHALLKSSDNCSGW